MGGDVSRNIFERIVVLLEMLLIGVTAAFTLLSIIWFAVTLATEYAHLGEKGFVAKEGILELLDVVLLTLIVLDVLQIVIARYTSPYAYLRVVFEVGILSLVRELISVEVKKPDPAKILSFSIAIFLLFIMWFTMVRNREVLERRIEVPHS